jgi:membrane associated rhomboid family serine protease
MNIRVQLGWAVTPGRAPKVARGFRASVSVCVSVSRFATRVCPCKVPAYADGAGGDGPLGRGGGRGRGGEDGRGDDWARWGAGAMPPSLVAWRRGSLLTAKLGGAGGGGGGGGSPLRRLLARLRIAHVLLALNVAVFLLQGAVGGRLLVAGAKVNTEIAAGQWYRLFTPMFLHASVSHLAVNAFSLYSTGPSVESWFGRARFTSLYIISGICGNMLSYMCTPTPSVGASGAIFGLVGATAVVLARHRRILGPRSRNSLNSLAYIMLVNFGMGMSPGSRIDNFGHLGGLLGGMVFAYLAGPRLVPVRGENGRTLLVDRSLLREAWDEGKLFFGGSARQNKRR